MIHQTVVGYGYYLMRPFNLTAGERNVLCLGNDCDFNFEVGTHSEIMVAQRKQAYRAISKCEEYNRVMNYFSS